MDQPVKLIDYTYIIFRHKVFLFFSYLKFSTTNSKLPVQLPIDYFYKPACLFVYDSNKS